jgi:hypothetical protein
VRLVHFAGGAKPWGRLPVPAKDRWLAARQRWLDRRDGGVRPLRAAVVTGNFVVDPEPSPQRATSEGVRLSGA